MMKLFKDVGNLILLIVLSLVPIVNLIVLGYFARVLKFDLEEPPKLSDYGELFLEGLKLFISILIYAIVPLVLIILGGAFQIFAHPLAPGGLFRFIVGSTLLIFGLLLLLVILFIGLPAIAISIRTGDFSKVFAFSEAWDLVQRVGLANYVLFYLLLIFFVFAAAAIGNIIPIVGSAVAGVFAEAFTFKALSILVNVKYSIPPPPP